MKRKQVNSILVNQTKRRNTVLAYICVIIILSILIVTFFMIYAQKNKKQYVSYEEKSNIDYFVKYEENEFFESEYIGKDKQYITSLISLIKTRFKYEILLDDVDVEYKYQYKIESEVIVRDKDTKNTLYEKREELLSTKENKTKKSHVEINENLEINYKYYNNKIKKLKDTYQLDNAESILNINMYVNVIGSCEEFINEQKEEKIITLSIPLTEETIEIEFIDNIINTQNNVMQCKTEKSASYQYIIIGILLTILDIILIIKVIRYEIRTRTAETIYEKSLKKILNNYGSSIQMLSGEFDFKKYQLLKIATFEDILEISEKLRQPILMKENEEKTGSYFVIPSNTKLLYVYRLKVSDIAKEMQENQKDI